MIFIHCFFEHDAQTGEFSGPAYVNAKLVEVLQGGEDTFSKHPCTTISVTNYDEFYSPLSVAELLSEMHA